VCIHYRAAGRCWYFTLGYASRSAADDPRARVAYNMLRSINVSRTFGRAVRVRVCVCVPSTRREQPRVFTGPIFDNGRTKTNGKHRERGPRTATRTTTPRRIILNATARSDRVNAYNERRHKAALARRFGHDQGPKMRLRARSSRGVIRLFAYRHFGRPVIKHELRSSGRHGVQSSINIAPSIRWTERFRTNPWTV